MVMGAGMIALELAVSALTLIAQILILTEIVSVMRFVLKSDKKYACTKEKKDGSQKNTHQDSPEWVEKIIDDYLENSAEKDNCR